MRPGLVWGRVARRRCDLRSAQVRRHRGIIAGIEIAAGNCKSIDLATSRRWPAGPDAWPAAWTAAQTWALLDLGAALGTNRIRILAIDPVDAEQDITARHRRVGRRAGRLQQGDGTVDVPFQFDKGQMTAFVQAGHGPGAWYARTGAAPGRCSDRHGNSRLRPRRRRAQGDPLDGPTAGRDVLRRRATAARVRGGSVRRRRYDLGAGPHFAEVNAIAGCLAVACQDNCQELRAAQQQWPAAMCAAAPPPDPCAGRRRHTSTGGRWLRAAPRRCDAAAPHRCRRAARRHRRAHAPRDADERPRSPVDAGADVEGPPAVRRLHVHGPAGRRIGCSCAAGRRVAPGGRLASVFAVCAVDDLVAVCVGPSLDPC